MTSAALFSLLTMFISLMRKTIAKNERIESEIKMKTNFRSDFSCYFYFLEIF
jgi:hypothetical protein